MDLLTVGSGQDASSRRHPGGILIKPPPVAPFIPKEQLFYSRLLLDFKAPNPGWKESDVVFSLVSH